MKYFKYIIVFILAISSLAAIEAQRNVYWLHGLNGNNAHWRNYDIAFENQRLMNCQRRNYNSIGSIDDITNGIFIPNNPNNIGIGHSLGGIVARNNERLGLGDFGGVITVHSPNAGASIATARNNGSAQSFLENTENTLVEAVNEAHEHLGIVIDIIEIFSSEPVPDEEFIVEELAGAFELITDPDLTEIVRDLDPRNNFMDGLNSFPATIPRIEIHGYERERELYRMACSMGAADGTDAVWNLDLSTDDPHPDDCFIDMVEDWRLALAATEASMWVLATTGAFNIFRIGQTIRRIDAAKDLRDAKRLFNDRAELEHAYEDLLGVRWVEQTTTGTGPDPDCIDEHEGLIAAVDRAWQDYQDAVARGGWEDEHDYYLDEFERLEEELEDFEQNNLPCPIVDYTITTFVPVDRSDQPHDGFILQEEQRLAGAYARYENREVNHMEAVNHPESWKNFNLVWDRQLGDFFRTEFR